MKNIPTTFFTLPPITKLLQSFVGIIQINQKHELNPLTYFDTVENSGE
jgi:hypothetical protein